MSGRAVGTADLPAIRRPDGRPYRPKKVVARPWYEDCAGVGLSCGVVVLGTHDVGRARELAEDCCARWYDLPRAVWPEVGWYRLGYSGARGEQSWVDDPVRGRAGVLFQASGESEEPY